MRFVNEIHHSTQVSTGARGPYARRVKPPQKLATGFPVEVLISVCHPPGSIFPEDGAIEIEGDAACVLDALESACLQIRAVGEDYVKTQALDPKWRDRPKRLQDEWQRAAKRRRAKGAP